MPTFKSIEEARAYIEKAVNEALRNEVLWVIQAEEANQIEDLVYGDDAYYPRLYERRWDMSDLSNIVGKVSGMTLIVENITPPSAYHSPILEEKSDPPTTDKNLSEVVEYGEGYDWFSPGPRPFTQATVDALYENKNHVKALVKKLRSKGIVVGR